MATKIYKGDPWKILDGRIWTMLAGGGIDLMNMDKDLYKETSYRIYHRPGHKCAQDGKPYYSFWVKRKSLSAMRIKLG
jgi:hypothetical protein